MVPGHGEFRLLLLYLEIREAVFLREFIAETQAVVVQAETDIHGRTVGAQQVHQQLVGVVTDAVFLAQDRRPGLVNGTGFGADDAEILRQLRPVKERKTHLGRQDNVLSLVRKGIDWFPLFSEAEGQCQRLVGAPVDQRFTGGNRLAPTGKQQQGKKGCGGDSVCHAHRVKNPPRSRRGRGAGVVVSDRRDYLAR